VDLFGEYVKRANVACVRKKFLPAVCDYSYPRVNSESKWTLYGTQSNLCLI